MVRGPKPHIEMWGIIIPHNLLWGFIIITILLCDSPAEAATWLDPSLKWKTLETPHFSINYYAELEDVARRLAPIAEEVHDTLTKALKYKIGMKTQVTLLDITDYGNGFTTVFPYPSITLYLTDLSTNLNPYKYDNYLRYLFFHEYVHALHLDIAEGGFALLRFIFGRNIFPNALEPWFMTEGLATYMETWYTNAGRGRDPRWDMMMRMDVLEDNVKSLDQAAVDTVLWPMGHLRYLYGVEFLEYLSMTYGEERLVALAHIYGDFLYTLGVDGAFLYLYRKNLGMLWNDWQEYLRGKYGKIRKDLGSITEPGLLTQTGYYNLNPRWAKDSRWIYYIQRNADDYPQLRRVDPLSGKSEKLIEGLFSEDSFGFSPDGSSLVLAKSDIYKNFYTYKDLYRYDLNTNKLMRLTGGLRASDPSYSPDGARIVFVKNEKGAKSLMEMDVNSPYPRPLSQRERGEQYFSPSFSPDGKIVVAAKHIEDGSQRIVLIDATTGQESFLTSEQYGTSEANPVFSPAGDYIFFDSDRTRIVNLYAYHLPSKRSFRLTNVLGGAMMPDLSPDGKKLAYVSYSSRGYDIAVMDVDPLAWKEIRSPVTVTTPVSSIVTRLPRATSRGPSSVEYASIHDYNPWPTLIPLFWIPDTYYNEKGSQTSIYIGSMDPLMRHFYYATLGYDFTVGRPAYTIYYANNQFLPQISFALSDYSAAYDWSGSTYWEREQERLLAFSFISNRVFNEYDRQTLTFGLESINLTNISSIDSLSPKPNLGNLNAGFISWQYRSSRAYPYSISPEDGMEVGFRIDKFMPELKSDYSFTNYSAFLNNYFRTPLKHQIIASLLKCFYSKGDQLEQGNFTWKYLSLRGYPYGTLKGNKGASLSLEYRFPLLYLEKGLMYGFTFFDRLWGTLFFDAGATSSAIKRGIGAELNLEANAMWGGLGFLFKLGYAKGLDEGGEEKTYFTIGL